MNSVHEPGSRIMSKNRLRNNTESNRIENRPSAPSTQPVASPRAQAARPAPRPCPPRACLQRAPRLPRPKGAAAAPACAPLSLARPSAPPSPAERPARPVRPNACCLRFSWPYRGLAGHCIAIQSSQSQYTEVYCDTIQTFLAFSCNTVNCIAIQSLQPIKPLAIQTTLLQPSLHKPQSQYKILYCNTISPQISSSLQYNWTLAIQFLSFFFTI